MKKRQPKKHFKRHLHPLLDIIKAAFGDLDQPEKITIYLDKPLSDEEIARLEKIGFEYYP